MIQTRIVTPAAVVSSSGEHDVNKGRIEFPVLPAQAGKGSWTHGSTVASLGIENFKLPVLLSEHGHVILKEYGVHSH